MKLAITALLLGSAAAFAPAAKPSFGVAALNASPTTGPQGKAASSAEEDLELTREVIMASMGMESSEEPAAEEASEE